MSISPRYLKPEKYYLAALYLVERSIRDLDSKPPYTYVIYRIEAPPMILHRIKLLLNTFSFPYHVKGSRFKILKRELDVWLNSQGYNTYVEFKRGVKKWR